MLRFLFNEERREDDGLLHKINEAITLFSRRLAKRSTSHRHSHRKGQVRRAHLNIWADALKQSLNELEQSKYCTVKYSLLFNKHIDSHDDVYRLHVYFYKSALVRIFSTLDKLGVFIDELLELNTASVKERFSYYTVLRNMYRRKAHPQLEKKLFEYKVLYQEAMSELRRKRNLEIHYVNAELLDDLEKIEKDLIQPHETEEVVLNIALLEQGYEMVCHSMLTVFDYSNRLFAQNKLT